MLTNNDPANHPDDPVASLAKLRQAIDFATEKERIASIASGASSMTRLAVVLSQARVVKASITSPLAAPYDISIRSVGGGAACVLHVERSALSLSIETLAQRITEEARTHMKVRSRTLREIVLRSEEGDEKVDLDKVEGNE